MRTIIAGSRKCLDYSVVLCAIEESKFEITSVLSGGAKGVDTLAIRYAKRNNKPYRIINAKWEHEGKAAGYLRNARMAAVADALIAVWDGKSRGTKNMIDIARRKGLQVFIWRYEDGDLEIRDSNNPKSNNSDACKGPNSEA